MNKHSILSSLTFILIYILSASTVMAEISWWNPAGHNFDVVDNQGWPSDKLSHYDRLPERAKNEVRSAVWNLSRHSAGLKIRFRSNAEKIVVRLQVDGRLAMPHMPATGVSGIDLYAKNSDGEWLWLKGGYAFGDTIQYEFAGINPKDAYHEKGREYHLYLPLYNSVKWMEIGVESNTYFEPLRNRPEKPVLVYGTSIAHGACASRPGMAWASILERKLDRPLINLGFSGNGRLEPKVIDLIADIDAKLYVLDCLPNLVPGGTRTAKQVKELVINAVRQLKEKRPDVPILLVDHAGYADASLNLRRQNAVAQANNANHEAFAVLKGEGYMNIFLLSKQELGLSFEGYVDGTHPTDLGMMEYAESYEAKVREILNEPAGKMVTTIPVTQMREPNNYDWEGRHRMLLELNSADPPEICFLGNSITHFWGGQPEGPRREGVGSWESTFAGQSVRNFGYGWDRVENVLWRVYHEELDGFDAKQIILKIGTNNLLLNSPKEILAGLELLINAIKTRQPKAHILILGLLPRRDRELKVAQMNLQIAQLTGKLNVNYIDIGQTMLQPDNKIDESLFSDGLHPNETGYARIGKELKKYIH